MWRFRLLAVSFLFFVFGWAIKDYPERSSPHVRANPVVSAVFAVMKNEAVR
jgi:hypothetical protein